MGTSDGVTFESDVGKLSEENRANDPNRIVRRNRPGASKAEWSDWPDEELDQMESTLAVQQFIQQLLRKDPNDVEVLLKAPEHQDEGVWKYEHLRQFCMELNLITVRLQAECTPATCSQMTATEQWIFLCAAHKNPKECSAIDYTRHTLDGAACLLNSNRYFPSRVNIKDSSVQKLGSICRRVYRIFSHAYFHHRQIYDEFERETSLCKRFTKFVTKYDLMTADTLIVPIVDPTTTQAEEPAKPHSPSSSPSKEASVKSPSSSPSATTNVITSSAKAISLTNQPTTPPSTTTAAQPQQVSPTVTSSSPPPSSNAEETMHGSPQSPLSTTTLSSVEAEDSNVEELGSKKTAEESEA